MSDGNQKWVLKASSASPLPCPSGLSDAPDRGRLTRSCSFALAFAFALAFDFAFALAFALAFVFPFAFALASLSISHSRWNSPSHSHSHSPSHSHFTSLCVGLLVPLPRGVGRDSRGGPQRTHHSLHRVGEVVLQHERPCATGVHPPK